MTIGSFLSVFVFVVLLFAIVKRVSALVNTEEIKMTIDRDSFTTLKTLSFKKTMYKNLLARD